MKILFLTLYLFSNFSIAKDWKWDGFEIIGNHKVSKEEILKMIPIKVGDLYKEDHLAWQSWCLNIKNHFKLHFTECSSVRYVDYKAFFILEVIEPGFEYRVKFRNDPKEDIPLASAEIMDLYEKLYKRLWILFDQGVSVKENSDKGYLDYSDKEMHEIVEKLIQLVPPYRENLLNVLAKDNNINKREKAANLLNWSVTNLADSIVNANRFLDDPSALVRNNISRFTLHFIEKVDSQKDLENIIDNLLLQLDRPSHGDRNKAIYNLLALAEKKPQLRTYINRKGFNLIQYMANTSNLSNVADPSKELIKLINEKSK